MDRYQLPRSGTAVPRYKWEPSIWGGAPGPAVGLMSIEFPPLPLLQPSIIGFVPIEAFARTARHMAEQLWEAVEDCFLSFESIWDPMQFIVRKMLQPQPVAPDILEFCGRFYIEPGQPSYESGYILEDNCLCSPSENCMARQLDPIDVWNRGGFWEVLTLNSDGCIAIHRR